MNSLLAMRVLLLAGEFFLGSTLVMNLAWLAAAAFPRRASLRHLIWLTAFGALLLFPVAVLVIPSQVLLEHPAAAPMPAPPPVMAAAAMIHAMPGTMIHAMPDTIPATMPDATPLYAMPDARHVAPPVAKPVARVNSFALPSWHDPLIAGAILALWLAGLLANGLRGVLAVYGLRALLRRSVKHVFPALPELARTRCRLRLFTGNGPGPVTWGFFKPVILLPQNAVDWPRDRLTAVLRHELAHVRRHDSLVQALSLLACALYWPNPLVWLGARALRREAEIAADDAVLASGVTPSLYASELVRLAAEFRLQRASFSGIAMAGPSALEERVKSVLAPTPVRTGVTAMDALKIAVLALVATASLAMLRPDIAVAQSGSVTTAPLPPLAPVPPVPPTPATRVAQAAAPAAPATPAAPPSVRDDGSYGPTGQEQMARQARHDLQMAADQAKRDTEIAKRDAEMAKRDAAREAADAKREAEQDAAEAKRDAEQEAADAKRESEQEGREAAAQARREVQEQMVKVRAAQQDVNKAIAEAHIGETVARAMAQAQPQIDAAMAQAMRQVGPEIDKAMAGVQPAVQRAIVRAKIGEVVARAMAKAQPQIDAAIAKARADAQTQPVMPVKPLNE